MRMQIRFIHKISPSPADVQGPYLAQPADLQDLASVRKWLRKIKFGNLGRVREWRKEGAKFLIFGASEWYTQHAIIIEPVGTTFRGEASPVQGLGGGLNFGSVLGR